MRILVILLLEHSQTKAMLNSYYQINRKDHREILLIFLAFPMGIVFIIGY